MAKKILIVTGLIFIVFCSVVAIKLTEKRADSGYKEGTMKITTDFLHQESIPKKYTCDGEDSTPEISVEGVPEEAKSLALILDDPDAPMGTFVHWLLFNIPPNTTKITSKPLPAGSIQGFNDFGRVNYGGPCPPSGVHRYFFKLYALDKTLDLKEGATKAQLESAMKGHIIEKTELIGLYTRKR